MRVRVLVRVRVRVRFCRLLSAVRRSSCGATLIENKRCVAQRIVLPRLMNEPLPGLNLNLLG